MKPSEACSFITETLPVGSKVQYGFIQFQRCQSSITMSLIDDTNSRSIHYTAFNYKNGFNTDEITKFIKLVSENFEDGRLSFCGKNGWEYYRDTEDTQVSERIQTQYDENTIEIILDPSDGEYYIEDGLNGRFHAAGNREHARVRLLEYAYNYTSYEYDKKIRLKSVAEPLFDSLTHIRSNADNPVEDGVYTCEELLGRADLYAEDTQKLYSEVQQLIENGNAPEDSDYVQELSIDLVSEQI